MIPSLHYGQIGYFLGAGGSAATPAVLSSPTGTPTGTTTATGSVTTDTGSGTLYRYASTNATEAAATVKASGSSSSVSVSGAQSGLTFTGLSAGTTYYNHYVQTVLGIDSNVVHSSSYTTTAASFTLNFEGAGPGPTPITTYYQAAHDIVFSAQSGVKPGSGTDGDTVLYQNGSGSVVMTASSFFVSPLVIDYAASGGQTYSIRDASNIELTSGTFINTDGDWLTGASLEFVGVAKTITFSDGSSDTYAIDKMVIAPL